VGKLRDTFAQFSNQPDNLVLQNATLNQSRQTASMINEASRQFTQMRNDIQNDMRQSIDRINALTVQITDLNNAIKTSTVLERPTADLEDQRDMAIRRLSEEIDINFYKGESNVIAVTTRSGIALADNTAATLYFNPQQIGPASVYPTNVAPVRLDDPLTGQDITADQSLGGKLGALLALRDQKLPEYHAQLDELTHKMAIRFEAQGLRLFTRADGTVPPNTPTAYAGFAGEVTVNPAVQNNNTLLRNGTDPNLVLQSGSAEVLRKVVQFAFGPHAYQRALGTVDISGATPLFTTLGLNAEARVVGNRNISTLNPLDQSIYINPGTNDTFTLQLGVGVPQTITINAGDSPNALVTSINTAFPGLAAIGPGGQLVFTANQNITIGLGTLGSNGLAELGLTAGVTTAQNPSFTVTLGKGSAQTITILPTDTSADLLAKINAIPGLNASLTVDGYLSIDPEAGGDISIADLQGQPLVAMGVRISNVAHVPFNVTGLGTLGNINGRIQGAASLIDYGQQIINLQSQDTLNVTNVLGAEESYRAALDQEIKNTTGVNLDEEMTDMIFVQTAYFASAKAVQVVERMMQELMDAFI